jgi:carbon storage regulator
MLALTGRVGDTFYIGDDVSVRVIQITEDKVRLAFDAPRRIPIDRADIRQAKQHRGEHAPFYCADGQGILE